MKPTTALALSVLLLGVSLALPALRSVAASVDEDEKEARASDGKAASTTVAVADISSIFNGYAKKKDNERELQGRMVGVQSELQALRTRALALAQEINGLVPGSPEHDAKSAEMKKLQKQGEKIQNERVRSLQSELQKRIEGLRSEITAEIAAVAKERGIDVVLERVTVVQQQGQPEYRWPLVHYASDACDLTSIVRDRLNERYRAQEREKEF